MWRSLFSPTNGCYACVQMSRKWNATVAERAAFFLVAGIAAIWFVELREPLRAAVFGLVAIVSAARLAKVFGATVSWKCRRCSLNVHTTL